MNNLTADIMDKMDFNIDSRELSFYRDKLFESIKKYMNKKIHRKQLIHD